MKKSLLVIFGLMCLYTLNAQKHLATSIPAKKISGFGKHYNTQGTQAACDTLKLDSAVNLWSPFYYNANEGYVLGVSNNVDTDSIGFNVQEDANYYDVSGSGYNYITGGLIDFQFANSTSAADLNKNLLLKVYDDAGGYPNNLLGSTTLKLSDVKSDVDNGFLTEFKFSSPIAIPANKFFYVSIDHSNFVWSASTKDSIAIIADSTDQAPAAAYQYIVQYPGGGVEVPQWFKTSDVWYADTLFNPLDVNLFLFPYVSNTLGGCSTLPVSILNFKGSIVNNQALLTWNTATELNNKGFEIERSNDGKNFKDIGFVKGIGTSSSLRKYSYTDASFSDAGAANYYRLKQIDLDGKTSYSNTIPLSLKGVADWKVYPNPVKDKINIELNLTADTKVSMQIISKDGKLLLNEDKGTLIQGQQQLNFNIQNLAAGSYFIRIKAGDDVYTQTIIKN